MLRVRLAPLPPKLKLLADTRLVFEELAVMTRFSADVSKSDTVTLIGPVAVSSLMVRGGRLEIPGRSFTGLTLTVTVRLVVVVGGSPSSTVTVIIAVPSALFTVVKLKLPLAAGLE